MALKLRMARAGRRNLPFYHIVVADSRQARDGKFIEKLGTYDPRLPQGHEKRVVINLERAKYWLGNGAQPSERVAIFLGRAGVIEMPAHPVRPQKSQPKEKAQQRVKDKEEKAKAKVEAAAAAKAEAEAAKNAPAPEPAAEAPAEAAAETPAAE